MIVKGFPRADHAGCLPVEAADVTPSKVFPRLSSEGVPADGWEFLATELATLVAEFCAWTVGEAIEPLDREEAAVDAGCCSVVLELFAVDV